MDDVRESESVVVRLLTCMCPDSNAYSSSFYHTSRPLGLLITGRTIHNNNYPLTTENGIHRPISCESLQRSAPDGSKLKNVFEILS